MIRHKFIIETAEQDLAGSLSGILQNLIEPPPAAVTLFERPAKGGAPLSWRLEAYFEEPRDAAELGTTLAALLGRPIPTLRSESVPDLNWVALSQAALPPVRAGRFTVHGSHDRDRVPRGPHSILIDAGEAFGTAHHATTHGCLAAIDRLTRRRIFRSVLDLGCGSGVLAIAAARALPSARILASDLDPQSVIVARANMAANGAGRRVTALCVTGLSSPALRRPALFDLLIANILAGPLIHMAGALTRAVAPGSVLVLSGILVEQSAGVIAAYLAHGCRVVRHERLSGWSTLVLERPRTRPIARPRPHA